MAFVIVVSSVSANHTGGVEGYVSWKGQPIDDKGSVRGVTGENGPEKTKQANERRKQCEFGCKGLLRPTVILA